MHLPQSFRAGQKLLRWTGLLLALLPTGLAPAGCSADRQAQPAVIRSEALELLPFESLADWKSYGDLVAVFRVVNEDRVQPPNARDRTPEPLRYVHVTVDRVLWARTVPPPSHLRFLTDGWLERDGTLVPVGPEDGPRLEVGHRYLGAFTLGDEIGLVTGSSALPLRGNSVALAGHPAPAAKPFEGASIDAVASALAKATADPVAVRYSELPPVRRFAMVVQVRKEAERRSEQRSTSTTGG